MKKGDSSITEFLHKAKALVVNLGTAGCAFDDGDLVLSVLNGLGSEFDPIVASVNSRATPIPYDELVDLLLSHEQRLLKNQPKVDITANLASKEVKTSGNRGRGRSRGGGRFGRGHGNQFQGYQSQYNGGRNGGRSSVVGI